MQKVWKTAGNKPENRRNNNILP